MDTVTGNGRHIGQREDASPRADLTATSTERATRRRFSRAYKLQILEQADGLSRTELGALLRREGLYRSHLSKWRQQRAAGQLDGKRRATKDLWQRLVDLDRENRRLEKELRQAKTVIAVQKKLSTLLGLDDESGTRS